MKVPEPRRLSSGNYFIQLRLDGESIPITAATSTECRHKAELIKAQHRNGKRVKLTDSKNLTLSQLIDDYIAAIKATASPATIKGYNVIKRNRFPDYIDKPYKDIKDWQTMIDVETKRVAAKTVKSAWGCLSTAMRRKKLPVPAVRLPEVQNNEHEFLTFEQIPKFLKAIRGDKAELGALICLHSFRLSEVCAMTWEDHIDLEHRALKAKGAYVQGDDGYVLKETNKNKKSRRTVPIMIERLYELLSASEVKTGKVITMAPETLQRRIDRACEAAGLPKIGAHGCRHSFASLAHHLKMPEKECMKLGGWSDPTVMHKIYTHIAEKDTEAWGRKMAKFYQNANKNANKPKKALKTQ